MWHSDKHLRSIASGIEGFAVQSVRAASQVVAAEAVRSPGIVDIDSVLRWPEIFVDLMIVEVGNCPSPVTQASADDC